jgi:hypothetical protein
MLFFVDIYVLIEEKSEQERKRDTEKKMNGSYVDIYVYLRREEYLGPIVVVDVANECLSFNLIYR